MKSYYRVTLGKGNMYAQECFDGNYIAIGFLHHIDLTGKLPEIWRDFNKEFAPVFLKANPEKSRIAAGMACGSVWTVTKGMNIGDFVLCPDGEGHFHVGEITGNYYYQADAPLEHRRPVRWLNQTIVRADLSEETRKAIGVVGTVRYLGVPEEIEKLIEDAAANVPIAVAEAEDAHIFPLEKYLEEFLIENWSHTELGKDYDIYEENGEIAQQYKIEMGRIDILAISKDKKTLLIVELKKGRASDDVVGQTLRYMGYAQEELAEKGQTVKGVIIALEDDKRIRQALVMVPNIEFYRYQVSFKLVKS
jgi:restriction system protein